MSCDGGAGPSLPGHRSFYMGFTPWPYDLTEEAQDDTYEIIYEHADLIAHHFDGGVPWPEAYEDIPYHPNVEAEIDDRVNRLRPGQKVYLALPPLNGARDGLADYWGREENMDLPDEWKDKGFDDPKVIQAYTNFCLYIVGRFNPDYVNIGIEVNLVFAEDDPEIAELEVLFDRVYTAVKDENPGLPVFLSFVVGSDSADGARRIRTAEKLLTYSDYVAVSTYPYLELGDEANPDVIPADWFSRMTDLAPGKPFAVAENGYIAEDLVLESYGVYVKGTEEWQAEYVRFLLEESNDLDAEFVVWFVPRDYDLLWEKIKDLGVDELYKAWRDTGLYDGEGNARKSLEVWDSWLG
jgi:hypothetical protein